MCLGSERLISSYLFLFADAGFAQQADSIDDGSRSTPERNNVKTIPKRGLAEMRRRMTNQCVERVKRFSLTTPVCFTCLPCAAAV